MALPGLLCAVPAHKQVAFMFWWREYSCLPNCDVHTHVHSVHDVINNPG
jgi:hypothetical protein